MKKTLLAYWHRFLALTLAGAMAVGLAACGSFVDRHYGPADTPATSVYQLEGRYIYLATAVDAYVSHPAADADLRTDLCTLDSTVYQSLGLASNTLLSGGDKTLIALQTAGVALRNLSLTVLDDFSLSATVEQVGERTIVLATIATEALTKMRIWRKTFLEPQLQAFQETGVDPGEDDFKVLNDKAASLHASIQDAC